MNSIQERNVLYLEIKLRSPLALSSGEDEWTDSDILRDFDGNPFVPGSSLAGAFRTYLGKVKNEPCLMGYFANGSAGRMSSLYISDLLFRENPVTNVRDGVALNEYKTAVQGSKFDMEIMEANALGYFFVEYVIREKDDKQLMEDELSKIIQGIQSGEIRLGSKKTRGFGQFTIETLKEACFNKENYCDYANVYALTYWNGKNCPGNCLEKWLNRVDIQNNMIHITIPLLLTGGISIRRYAAKKGEPDFVQLTDHGEAVVPGSSLAGALRHRMKKILRELEKGGWSLPVSASTLIESSFGYVTGDQACSSNIIVGETEVKGATPLTMVRTGISRFESAVRDGTLYKEITYVGGTAQVEILVKKESYVEDTKWMVGLLLLAIKDLQNGLLAVGGQTAIGRGVFSSNGPILIDGKENEEDDWIANSLNSLGVFAQREAKKNGF